MTSDEPDQGHASACPRVSVVVRSMDRPGLRAALASVFAQDLRPLDLVVVNASGRPHSPLPAAAHDVDLRLIPETPTRLARAAAANLGLAQARGELVIFLDDDDEFLPGHLAKLVAALQARPDAVAAFADVELGSFTPAGWTPQHQFAAEFDRHRLLFENYLPMHAVLFRRASAMAAEPACRFDERLDLFEDWDFWLQLTEHGTMVRAPGVSARYVMNEAGGSGVFESSEAALAARALLLAKWQQRTSPVAHAGLLRYVQGLFRSVAELEARGAHALQARHSLQETVAALQATVQARDTEVAAYAATVQDLRQVVAARETDIGHATAMIADLQRILAARETELANVHAALAEVRATVAALQAEGPLTALQRTLKRRTHDPR